MSADERASSSSARPRGTSAPTIHAAGGWAERSRIARSRSHDSASTFARWSASMPRRRGRRSWTCSAKPRSRSKRCVSTTVRSSRTSRGRQGGGSGASRLRMRLAWLHCRPGGRGATECSSARWLASWARTGRRRRRGRHSLAWAGRACSAGSFPVPTWSASHRDPTRCWRSRTLSASASTISSPRPDCATWSTAYGPERRSSSPGATVAVRPSSAGDQLAQSSAPIPRSRRTAS
jgi:hypothetical protein